jgi:hypothetical protein
MITNQPEARLLVWMGAIALPLTLGIVATGHPKFAIGFVAGAVVALLGYLWLCELAATALDSGNRRVLKALVFKLIIRYPLFFGTLYFFSKTNWLPAWAVLAGLSLPLAGAVAEGLYQVQSLVFPSRSQLRQ